MASNAGNSLVRIHVLFEKLFYNTTPFCSPSILAIAPRSTEVLRVSLEAGGAARLPGKVKPTLHSSGLLSRYHSFALVARVRITQ